MSATIYTVFDWWKHKPTSIQGTDCKSLQRTADRKNKDHEGSGCVLPRYTVIKQEGH